MPKKKTAPVKKPPPAKRAAAKRPPPKKKARVEWFRFENTDSDPIIENLKEVSAKHKQIRSADNEILDHVALEGLTGITFSRLCLILDAIIPSLKSCNDDAAQDHVWSVIVNRYMRRIPGASIQIFCLDLSKQSQSSTKSSSNEDDQDDTEQNKNFCIDKSIKLPSQSLKRMAKSDWMLHPVLDGQIMGSCPNYTSRRNISKEVMALFDKHGPRESLLLVNEKYDLKNIYFVADQEVRRRALLPMSFDPNMDITLREYACLELIGRTRCFGIVFPNDKTLGRYRILLTAKGLITQYQQTCSSFIIHHIRRFSKYNLESGAKAFKGGIEVVKERVGCGEAVDDEDDDLDSDEAAATVKSTCCNPARLKCDRNFLRMVYDAIALSKGRSMADIRRKLRLPKSHVRNHLKNLANTGLIGSHTRFIYDKKTRIYRARHRSKRRRLARLARQRKILRGVRAKWDETDIRARELLGAKRSQFTQAEDSLIILSRITGLLIDPKCPKSFLVPKKIIRDILHDELFESHDKTSDAVLRRITYLRRLPSNVALINEITAELRDDPDITRLIGSNKDICRSDDKMVKFFKQLLRAIRAKLPHLLGLTGSLVASSPIEIKSYEDLIERFELIDCRHSSIKKVQNPPQCTLVQLIRSTPQCYRLKIAKCEDMQTVMLIASRCVETWFNLEMRLKVPVRVVGLDQENEYFKAIFEQAKQSKEASRLIANLTTPNPTADSRRALFMLRNALKLQPVEKCGNLADALVIQPCDIEFSSEQELTFDKKDVLNEFLSTSKFSNEIKREPTNNVRDSLNRRRRERYRKSKNPNEEAEQSKPQPSKQEMLFRTMEAAMNWIGTHPGIELDVLKQNMAPMFEVGCIEEHLREILELMESLELISRDSVPVSPDMCRRPLLLGYRELLADEQKPIITFAPRANAYVRLSQLIDAEL
uniref:General transcription factor 3C polypeptide 1 n=1 Tax=Aceria tosichella TaxID=561515 RepID=A0A6G1SCM8_9ACAR